MSTTTNHRILPLIALCSSLAYAGPAQAQVGDAAASDVSIHIDLFGVTTLDVDPQAPSTVSAATTATIDSHSSLGLDLGGTLLHVSTGLLTTTAQYAPGSIAAAGGQAQVAGLDLTALGLGKISLLSVSADVIQSRAAVHGYCLPTAPRPDGTAGLFDDYIFAYGFDSGNLNPGDPGSNPGDSENNGDDTTLAGLHLSILGIDVPDLPLNPAPNTTVDLSALGVLGASLVLNEQTVSGDGITTIAKSSNALHLTLAMAGLITADVVVAHSEGALDCSQ